MRKLLVLLFASVLLVACGNDEPEEDNNKISYESSDVIKDSKSEDELEVVYKKELEVELTDDELVTIELQGVGIITDGIQNFVTMEVSMTNKENRTYEMFISELKVDGKSFEPGQMFVEADEIKPDEKLVTYINGFDHDELTIKEHVQGTIVFSDYEGNRNEMTFSEYINN